MENKESKQLNQSHIKKNFQRLSQHTQKLKKCQFHLKKLVDHTQPPPILCKLTETINVFKQQKLIHFYIRTIILESKLFKFHLIY